MGSTQGQNVEGIEQTARPPRSPGTRRRRPVRWSEPGKIPERGGDANWLASKSIGDRNRNPRPAGKGEIEGMRAPPAMTVRRDELVEPLG